MIHMIFTLEIYLILECKECVLCEYKKGNNKTRDPTVNII